MSDKWDEAEERAEGWYNNTKKIDLLDYASTRQIDVGQHNEQLHENWAEIVMKEKAKELFDKGVRS